MILDYKLSLYLLRFSQGESGLEKAVSDIKDAIYEEIKRERREDVVRLDDITMILK